MLWWEIRIGLWFFRGGGSEDGKLMGWDGMVIEGERIRNEKGTEMRGSGDEKYEWEYETRYGIRCKRRGV